MTKALTQQSIVMPAVSVEDAVKAWDQYQQLKKSIVDKEIDVQLIDGKEFLKKSYWRKVATFFNLTTEVIEERQEQVGKTLVWHFTIKAIAPNGRFAIGTGSCDAYEKAQIMQGEYMNYNKWKKEWFPAKPNSIHNIRTTAETRATNRAISNLLGGGEVSAEEINSTNYEEKQEQVEMKTAGEVLDASNAKCPECNAIDPWHKPTCSKKK